MVEKVRNDAEEFYRSGTMHCAEAVVAAVKNGLRPELSDDVLRAAAGFGAGSGAGCICGAISGATIAFGIILDDDKRRAMRLTRNLHRWFTSTYSATCCKVITSKHRGICPTLTGEVAGKVAELITG